MRKNTVAYYIVVIERIVERLMFIGVDVNHVLGNMVVQPSPFRRATRFLLDAGFSPVGICEITDKAIKINLTKSTAKSNSARAGK